MPRYTFEVQGADKLLKKLGSPPTHARPWRRTLTDLLKYAKRLAQERAPKATGRLARRNRYRYQQVPVPLWGILSNEATRKGFRYGFALDAGHAKKKGGKTYYFHRRGGGGSTKDWFKGILDVLGGYANRRMRQLEQDVEQEWRQ